MKKIAKVLMVVALGLLAEGCATAPGPVGAIGPRDALTVHGVDGALPRSTLSMPSPQVAGATPAGFLSFCTRFADQCAADPSQPSTVALTPAGWLAMEQANQSVNRAMRPMSDEKHYGRAEYWNIPTDGYGDCEDYALTKRKELIAAGFPQAALRMAVVITRLGERHAVLTVSTDRGDFVLDNLENSVTAWNDTGYQWIERQSATNMRAWLALDKAADSTYVASIASGPLGAIKR